MISQFNPLHKILFCVLFLSVFPIQFQGQNLSSFFDDIESHRDFATTDLTGWTTLDYDKNITTGGPIFEYPNRGKACAWLVYNPSKALDNNGQANTMPDWQAYSGKKMLVSMSQGGSNDWLITKELRPHIGGEFSFYAKSASAYFGDESFKVGYSTSNTDPTSFTFFNGDSPYIQNDRWKQHTFQIPANVKYIAIVCVSPDGWGFMIDDIKLVLKSAENAPKAVDKVSVLANQTGALKVNLSWQNPSLQENGNALSSLTSIQIYRGMSLRSMKMIKEYTHPSLGESLTYEDVLSAKGSYYYSIVANNVNGESPYYTSEATYVGIEKIAGAPKKITVVPNVDNQSVIRWGKVNYGQYGGVLETPVTGYTLVRNTKYTSDTLARYTKDTFFIEAIPALNLYTYQVIAQRNANDYGIPASILAYSGTTATQNPTSIGILQMDEPFLCIRKSSISQSIYTPEQIKKTGIITDLSYFTDFFSKEDTADKSQFQIYMSTTPRNEFGRSVNDFKWIYFRTQTLVANAKLTFFGGSNAVNIHLDQAFYYDANQGENLVITMVKPLKEEADMPKEQSYYFLGARTDSMRTVSFNAAITDLSQATNQPAYWQTSLSDMSPNVMLNTVTAFAKLKGEVVVAGSTKAIAHANIVIKGKSPSAMQWNGQSDSTGQFTVPALLADTYTLTISKLDFGTRSFEITLHALSDTNLQFELYNAIPMTIQGVVTDLKGNPIENVELSLSGYSSQSVLTSTDGKFVLSAYQQQDYKLQITHPLYISQEITFNRTQEQFDTTFILKIIHLSPINVEVENENKIGVVTWQKPIGTKNPTELAWGPKNNLKNAWGAGGTEFTAAVRFMPADLDTLLMEKSTLTHVRIYFNSACRPFIEIYEGANAALLLHKEEHLIKTPGWYTFELLKKIVIDKTKDLYIAVRYPVGYEAYPMGIDDGPQVAGKGNAINEGKGWTTMGMNGKNWNIYGITHQTMEANPISYTVRRGVKGSEDQIANWKLLHTQTISNCLYRDSSLAIAPADIYRYAIQAKYNDDSLSLYALSNDLIYDMEFDVSLTVSCNGNANAKGTLVALQSSDNAHQTEALISSNGKIVFPKMWRGNYQLRVQRDNYENAIANFYIGRDTLIDIALKEIICQPSQVEVDRRENSALLKWNLHANFTDNMETYSDFRLSNIGEYILEDVDKGLT
ncbi:MAG: carboxypeptidase regulatory-like domain-containing protein, partial [Bacteroidales bacterium]